MRTVVLDPETAGLEELLERRRRSGLDRLDEVWEGVLHLVPAPSGPHADILQQLAEILGPVARAAGLFPAMDEVNIGESEHDYRIPDGAIFRERPRATWFPTAALVVEVRSPGDEAWDKLPFYAQHEINELLILDPGDRSVHLLILDAGEYRPAQESRLLSMRADELQARIDWPEIDD